MDNPAINDAIARITAADKAAESSRMAFALGADTFTAYLQSKAADARKRIEDAYRADGNEPAAIPESGNSEANRRSGSRISSGGFSRGTG